MLPQCDISASCHTFSTGASKLSPRCSGHFLNNNLKNVFKRRPADKLWPLYSSNLCLIFAFMSASFCLCYLFYQLPFFVLFFLLLWADSSLSLAVPRSPLATKWAPVTSWNAVWHNTPGHTGLVRESSHLNPVSQTTKHIQIGTHWHTHTKWRGVREIRNPKYLWDFFLFIYLSTHTQTNILHPFKQLYLQWRVSS